MEDLSIGILFILTCFGAFASTATHDAKTSKELSELDKLFIDKIHEIEKRYDESLETLRNELMQDNEILRKSVDELNTKLEIERKESSYAIQQLEKDFSEKETKLTKGINGFTDHLVRERSIGDRKTGVKRQMPMYGSAQVAFSVRLSTNSTQPLSLDKEIVFDDLLLNVGSAYNNSRGTFVAPVPGVYFFTTSLLAYGKTSHHAKLVKNGQELVRVDFNDVDGYDDSSQAVIVQLNRGDIVAVQNVDYSNMLYLGYNYSTFSGFLLYEYEDMTPAVGK